MAPPMTGKQYKAAIARYGLTQGQASWLFGGRTKMSGRRWAAEGAPYSVALVLTLMENYEIGPDDIESLGRPYRRKKERPPKKRKRR